MKYIWCLILIFARVFNRSKPQVELQCIHSYRHILYSCIIRVRKNYILRCGFIQNYDKTNQHFNFSWLHSRVNFWFSVQLCFQHCFVWNYKYFKSDVSFFRPCFLDTQSSFFTPLCFSPKNLSYLNCKQFVFSEGFYQHPWHTYAYSSLALSLGIQTLRNVFPAGGSLGQMQSFKGTCWWELLWFQPVQKSRNCPRCHLWSGCSMGRKKYKLLPRLISWLHLLSCLTLVSSRQLTVVLIKLVNHYQCVNLPLFTDC